MEREKFDTYIREVTSHVKFPFDRRAIAKELQAHMEDLYEDLLSQDIDEEQAAQLTVDYMGDSEELGKELNEVHHPLWSWIWLGQGGWQGFVWLYWSDGESSKELALEILTFSR